MATCWMIHRSEVEVKNGHTVTVELTNRKESNILVHKVDANTGEGLYGATFFAV